MDRDGVICEKRHHPSGDERNYIINRKQFHWIPGSKEAIVKLLENDYFVVVVSNQACVGKGLVDVCQIYYLMRDLNEAIRLAFPANPKRPRDGRIARFRRYFCPHTPEDDCSCRKPRPGMIYRAAADWNLCLRDAWMVGDSMTDLKAGWLAGIRKLIKVGVGSPTARKKQEIAQPRWKWKRNTLEGKGMPNLEAAVEFILEWEKEPK